MNGLPLPTDNLYKFLALVGVTLLLVPSYFTFNKSAELHGRSVALDLAIDKLEIEQKYLELRVEKQKETVAAFKAGLVDADIEKQGRIPIPISPKEFANAVERSQELLKEQQLKLKEINAAQRDKAFTLWQLRCVNIVGPMLGAVGALLATYGFRKWAWLQRRQDALVMKTDTRE